MEKLGAVDANFLYTETESVLNHIASVQRLRLAAGTDCDDAEGAEGDDAVWAYDADAKTYPAWKSVQHSGWHGWAQQDGRRRSG